MNCSIKSVISLLATPCCLACTASAPPPPPSRAVTGFTFETRDGGFSSFGWTGTLHHVTGAAGAQFGVKVTECSDDGVCRFEGPNDPLGVIDRRRCLFRISQTCTTDADC